VSKLWGGRFAEETHREVEAYTSSLSVDSRLWKADIQGSIAHARMLGECRILNEGESEKLIAALMSIGEELAAGALASRLAGNPTPPEDVHSMIEQMLYEKAGPVAGKLHTARSRNDQVATATRLYAREAVEELRQGIEALQNWLLETAQAHTETVLPGLTHLQHAQPVSLAHHLMAYFWMLQRDRQRLGACFKEINRLPLGSAALAGTSFPIDRQSVAKELGFESVTENSLDAVSDRDFVVQFLSDAALVMTHLSRLSEELILWSMPEFGYVELGDSVTTGSSIMPQKKNPDVAELIRGRTGRVNGALVGALTMLKGLPLSYNRDLQEDKGFLFEGLDTARSSVRLMLIMLQNARFNPERMQAALRSDFSNATDLADHLVAQSEGLTFREAHEVVGKIVRYCLEQKISLEDLSLSKLREYSPVFTPAVLAAIQPLNVMKARTSEGGTSPQAVSRQLASAKARLQEK
jgi:argininosuccinate lyase